MKSVAQLTKLLADALTALNAPLSILDAQTQGALLALAKGIKEQLEPCACEHADDSTNQGAPVAPSVLPNPWDSQTNWDPYTARAFGGPPLADPASHPAMNWDPYAHEVMTNGVAPAIQMVSADPAADEDNRIGAIKRQRARRR